MSVVIYAGAAQFAALGFLATGAGLGEIFLMTLLLFSFRATAWSVPPYGMNELIGVGVVVGLRLWKGNTLLSILSGTACYMVLRQSDLLMKVLG